MGGRISVLIAGEGGDRGVIQGMEYTGMRGMVVLNFGS